MHGKHLRRRGQWWHYYRNRPKRYADVETRAVITFALRTTSISEAKLKAAEISFGLEQQWEDAKRRGVSLSSQSANIRYAAAVETNLIHGLQPKPAALLDDTELFSAIRSPLRHQLRIVLCVRSNPISEAKREASAIVSHFVSVMMK